MNDILGLMSLLFLVLLNGYFVASEFALVSVRRTRIEQLVFEHKANAKAVQRILKNLDLYIAATQLGITMASLSIGFVAEPAIEHLLAPVLTQMGVDAANVKTISFATAFLVSTALHIVFGELAPKTVALQRSEQTSMWVARPLIAFTFVFKPFIFTLNWLGNQVVKLFGLKPEGHHHTYTSEEIRMIVDSSGEAGALEDQEKTILKNVFAFKDTSVKAIMTHRTEVEALESGSNLRQLIQMKKSHGYSRVPIYEGSLDNIVGVVHTADALMYMEQLDQVSVNDLIRPILFIPEHMKVDDLFTIFQKRKTHLVVVVDEFGGMSGIVTLEDVLEELVGDIYDETDEEEEDITQVGEHEYLLEADVHVDDVEALLGTELDGKEFGDFETVAGLIFSKLGYIPQIGEVLHVSGWCFEVQDASPRQIKKVRIFPSNAEVNANA